MGLAASMTLALPELKDRLRRPPSGDPNGVVLDLGQGQSSNSTKAFRALHHQRRWKVGALPLDGGGLGGGVSGEFG